MIIQTKPNSDSDYDFNAQNTTLFDLHVHTEYSDGSSSPDEIFESARSLGIRNLALTDHDTTHWLTQSGIDAVKRAQTFGICLVRGIELSARDCATGKKAHILGYWPGCEPIVAMHLGSLCRVMQERRTEVSYRQMEVLQKMGYLFLSSEVENNCKADQIFKHHILKTLYDKGLIGEIMGDFYSKHFIRGGDCFFDIKYLSACDAVAAIRAAKGFPVLAHPGQQKNYSVIPNLIQAGLMGIEYLHPTHTVEDRSRIAELSNTHGLFMTGGSDFHGIYHQERSLGACRLPFKYTEELVSIGLLQ